MPHPMLNKVIRGLFLLLLLACFNTATAGFYLLTGPSARIDESNVWGIF